MASNDSLSQTAIDAVNLKVSTLDFVSQVDFRMKQLNQ